MKKLLLFLALLLSPCPIFAATFYVDAATGSDSNPGTSTGSAWLTIAHAVATAASGDTVYIKSSGTYTQTSTLAITQANLSLIGYQTTPGDNGTPPLITTATNSTVLFTSASAGPGTNAWTNIAFTNTAATPAQAIKKISNDGTAEMWSFLGDKFDGFTVAIDGHGGSGSFAIAFFSAVSTEVKNSTAQGIYLPNAFLVHGSISGCYVHNNGGNGMEFFNAGTKGVMIVDHSIFASNGASGIGVDGIGIDLQISNSTIANNTTDGVVTPASTGTSPLITTNSIYYGNGSFGISSGASLSGEYLGSHHNGFSGSNSNWTGSPTDVTITADPFTASGSGDYSLNATAGGGAALKGAGFPGAFPGGTSTGHLDIGAVQSSSGGGTVAAGNFGLSN